ALASRWSGSPLPTAMPPLAWRQFHHRRFAANKVLRPPVFLGETRIENSAEIHVAGVPARAQYHAPSGLDVQGLALVRHRDSQNPAGELFLPDEARHAVPQQNLHTELSRAGFERTHQRRPIPSR